MKEKDRLVICCKTCIHHETSYYRADHICVPQFTEARNPKSVIDNKACQYYERASEKRIRKGPFGSINIDTWDIEKGKYVETKRSSEKKRLSSKEKSLAEKYKAGEISFIDYLIG